MALKALVAYPWPLLSGPPPPYQPRTPATSPKKDADSLCPGLAPQAAPARRVRQTRSKKPREGAMPRTCRLPANA